MYVSESEIPTPCEDDSLLARATSNGNGKMKKIVAAAAGLATLFGAGFAIARSTSGPSPSVESQLAKSNSGTDLLALEDTQYGIYDVGLGTVYQIATSADPEMVMTCASGPLDGCYITLENKNNKNPATWNRFAWEGKWDWGHRLRLVDPNGKATNYCLSLNWSGGWNGNRLRLETCNGEQRQLWRWRDDWWWSHMNVPEMDHLGRVTVKEVSTAILQNRSRGGWIKRVADAKDYGKSGGTPVQLWDCGTWGSWAKKNQRWLFLDAKLGGATW